MWEGACFTATGISCGLQVVATAVSVVFSAAMTYILFKIVDKLVGLRVDARVEEEGLDIYEHGESAYNS